MTQTSEATGPTNTAEPVYYLPAGVNRPVNISRFERVWASLFQSPEHTERNYQ